MLELFAPVAVSLMIFVCTFGAAVSGIILHKKLPVDHLSEDSKDVIKLVMGLIATMAALVLGLLIASANSSPTRRRAVNYGRFPRPSSSSTAFWPISVGGKRTAPQASCSRFGGG
jgi:hypothetical protein